MTAEERKFLLSLFDFDNKLTDNLKIKKLYSMSTNIEKNYQTFEIKKKSGKLRKIYSPNYYLKNVQRAILNNVLYDRSASNYATAYCKGKNVRNNALPHLNKNIILKLDIKNFFDNLSFTNVYQIYNSYGFSNSICGLLSYLCTYNDYLPQGAPTSSYLSNLILRDFDYKVGSWCRKRNITYTRYSDDMTFSMDEFNREIIRYIRKCLYKYGLGLNNEKICVINNSNKQKITGIVVNNKIQTDINYRKKIRQEMYYIKKYGIKSHLNKIGYNKSIDSYIDSLKGRINFVLQIDPNNSGFKNYLDIVNRIII